MDSVAGEGRKKGPEVAVYLTGKRDRQTCIFFSLILSLSVVGRFIAHEVRHLFHHSLGGPSCNSTRGKHATLSNSDPRDEKKKKKDGGPWKTVTEATARDLCW